MNCLPVGTELLTHQIAGHVFGEDERNLGMLKHPSGFVLKRIDGERGQRELDFYTKVFSSSEKTCTLLKEFLPSYHGIYTTDFQGSKLTYIQLDDITAGYKHPCIMDIKMGKQTWNPHASEKKRAREESKYRETKEKFGFSIPGFRVYDLVKETEVIRGKDYGKSLTTETVTHAFLLFLNNSNHGYKVVANKFLAELTKIHDYFDQQNSFHFFASSLLFVYDAAHLTIPGSVDIPVTLKMIDFAHVFPGAGQKDLNYLFGLKSLVHLFQKIAVE